VLFFGRVGERDEEEVLVQRFPMIVAAIVVLKFDNSYLRRRRDV
jgi:hypothetical protein